MKKTFRLLCCLFICQLSIASTLLAQSCENRCLDFDGNGDFVSVFPFPLAPDPDFTTEMWFASSDPNTTNTNCINNFKRLFVMGGSNTRFEIGECGGDLNIFWLIGGNTSTTTIPMGTINVNDNTWRHLAVTRSGTDIEVYLDCNLIYANSIATPWIIGTMILGHWNGGPTPNDDWIGRIDDVRLWDYPRTLVEIDAQKSCVLSGSETGLQIYWTMDEGIERANNATAVPSLTDFSGNGNIGQLFGFDMGQTPLGTPPGSVSNIVCSGAGMVYPNLNSLDMEIRNYYDRSVILTEICDGDPAHYSLLKNGQKLPSIANVSVQWQYNDGLGWLNLNAPPYIDFCFPVPTGNINLINPDCANSSTGFIDRKFRAISSVTDPVLGETCDYTSKESSLKICCPISPATVSIVPPDPLCEGETVNLTVNLTSPDLFVMTPGPNVDIEWFFNGSSIGFIDQTSISYTFTAPIVTAPTSFCFEAKVTNCNNKVQTFSACLNVDPEPVCGTISGLPSPPTLTTISTTPRVYSICPGEDAAVGIDLPSGFMDCVPNWEYSFDNSTWFAEGSISNNNLNTNILPSSLWPSGATSIYYRIKCNPLSNPSGCDPCYSNVVEIQLETAPAADFIVGPTAPVCTNNFPIPLNLNTGVAGLKYSWYHDGILVASGTSTSYQATAAGCYWVEISNSCFLIETPQFCIDDCEIIPIISCPISPNECACLGQPITISACDSESTCGPNTGFQYTWYIDGVLAGTGNCQLTHTPAITGATYKVEIVDTATGCMAMKSVFIQPCDK